MYEIVWLIVLYLFCCVMSMHMTGDESTDLHISREGKLFLRLKSLFFLTIYIIFYGTQLFKGSEN